MDKTLDIVVYSISLVVGVRDQYTALHQKRVAELARAIAMEIGLPEWEIMDIHVAGLLHDMGKLSVPVEILIKPAKINHYEFCIIQNHPRAGYEILSKIGFPEEITQSALQHHERLDGSGYPRGLSGNNICSKARILAVADVVEAMSSHRPYRPALGLDSGLEEISRNKNILYDPEVVDACLKLFTNDSVRFNRLMEDAIENEHLFEPVKA